MLDPDANMGQKAKQLSLLPFTVCLVQLEPSVLREREGLKLHLRPGMYRPGCGSAQASQVSAAHA